MALRLLEIVLPKTEGDTFATLTKGESFTEFYHESISGASMLIKVLLPAERTEAFIDNLEKKFSRTAGFRIVMLPVETTLPRFEERKNSKDGRKKSRKGLPRRLLRIGREELYSEIVDGIQLSNVYVAMVVLSSIVAIIGLLRDNSALVIGSMVIAPLLGPNVGLALATALGDYRLGLNALKTNVMGVTIVLALSIAIGYLFEFNPNTEEIVARTKVHILDIVLALAAGSAGVIAFTTGVSVALIGVMVAVALLPPAVALGLLIGSGDYALAYGALMLLLTNVICVNLAGVTTFLIQGIRPRTWWKAARAKKTSLYAIVLWSLLLLLLLLVVILSPKYEN